MKGQQGGRGGSRHVDMGVPAPAVPGDGRTEGGVDPLGSQKRLKAAGQAHPFL